MAQAKTSKTPVSPPPLPSDSELTWLIRLLPRVARPYALLARFDRPIGWWLLFWPGAWAIGLSGALAPTRTEGLFQSPGIRLYILILLGSILMRAAGCVYNDIIDRDLDLRVSRTQNRPLAAGRISLKAAWLWLVILSLGGLVILLQLRWEAQLTALFSLALVAAYPFIKRISGWPQLWLGLVFSWAAPTAWVAATGELSLTLLWLYLGTIAWIVGYDTAYACQDREDDAILGIGSSALSLGRYAKIGVGFCYLIAIGLIAGAIWTIRPQLLALFGLLPAVGHLFISWLRFDPSDNSSSLKAFRANHFSGFLIALACAVIGLNR